MKRTIEFYFDFVSPYSYLAHQRIPALADRYSYELSFNVVKLAELKRLAGNFGPPTRQIPIKLNYARADLARWSKKYGVPLVTPLHSDWSLLNRGTFYAAEKGVTKDYVTLAYHKVWGEGGHMTDGALMRGIAEQLHWDADAFTTFAGSTTSNEAYQASTSRAHSRGVFGVPTMMIDDEMWWGNDRLHFLEARLDAESKS